MSVGPNFAEVLRALDARQATVGEGGCETALSAHGQDAGLTATQNDEKAPV
jgi:hypothetical protein